MAKKVLHTKAEVVRDHIDGDQGVIDAVVGSTEVVDRMGDVIEQDGWNLKNFKNNPVILWGHNMREERPPIGKALKVWLENKGKKKVKLMFKVKFDLQDTFAAEIFRKIKEGFINTVSVGFVPKEWEELDKDLGIWGGLKYTKQELLELSFVPVPANPEALVALRAMKDKRFSPATLAELFPEDASEAKERALQKEKLEEPSIEVSVKIKNQDLTKDEVQKIAGTAARQVHEKIDGVLEKKKEEANKDEKAKEPIKEEGPSDEATETEKTTENAKEEEESKRVLPYKSSLGTLPESEVWDGAGERAKATVEDLKLMCAWVKDESEDNKSAYKLPHHKAEGHKAVWRGVAASMASLLGARGGADIPEADRRGVYNHLVKHYKEFDKKAPEFRLIEEQALANLDEELLALTLEREEKHVVRLIKKVLKEQKETKKEMKSSKEPQKTTENKELVEALNVLNNSLSQYDKGSTEGGAKNKG